MQIISRMFKRCFILAMLLLVSAQASFAQTTYTITTIAGTGTAGFSGDGGPAINAQIERPFGIAIDANNNIYFSDYSHRIRKINASNGVITTIAGTGVAGFSGDGGLANLAQLNSPVGLAIDNDQNLLVCDLENHRIRKIDLSTGVITTIAGTGAIAFSGNGELAINAALNHPTGILVDKNNDIYISDRQNHRIRVINHSTNIITTYVGSGNSGNSGDGGFATNARISTPYFLTTDSTGNLIFVDTANHNVRKVDASTNIITTLTGNGVAG